MLNNHLTIKTYQDKNGKCETNTQFLDINSIQTTLITEFLPFKSDCYWKWNSCFCSTHGVYIDALHPTAIIPKRTSIPNRIQKNAGCDQTREYFSISFIISIVFRPYSSNSRIQEFLFMQTCPCGSQQPYQSCCEPFVTSSADAPTAEKLMRARYSAYVLGAVDFIFNSTIEEKRKECDEKAIRKWSQESVWHGLEIKQVTDGGPEHKEGVVEFIAQFSENGVRQSLHEKATFKKVDGKWFYEDSEIQKPKPFIRTEAKISRNDPCPCGSGKKYKKCCGG